MHTFIIVIACHFFMDFWASIWFHFPLSEKYFSVFPLVQVRWSWIFPVFLCQKISLLYCHFWKMCSLGVAFCVGILYLYFENINLMSSDFCCFCWKVSCSLILGPFFVPCMIIRFSQFLIFNILEWCTYFLNMSNAYVSQYFLNLFFIVVINFWKFSIIIFLNITSALSFFQGIYTYFR